MAEEIVKQDTKLIIKISNKEPIELVDLTKSLFSLASQFSSYVEKNGTSKEEREARLFVKEIRSGSVIIELIELATVGLIPFAENMNTIFEFATYCKNVFAYLLKGSETEEDKPELSTTDYKELSAIVNPVAKDNASQINFSTTVNGNVILNFNLDSTQSNAIQNIVKRQLNALKKPETEDDVYEKVVLTWFQARSDIKSKKGNKGVIESINKKELNVIFNDDSTKEEMLHGDINPLTTAYVVDAKIENINGKPAVYRIMKLHEYFDVET
jgi:hypothetical protein